LNDSKTFAQLIVLLEFISQKLSAKIMIMTATLPTFLKEKLKSAIGSFTEIKADEKLFKEFARHKIILKDGLINDNLDLIKENLDEGKKVLVVCNTVKQAQNIYKFLADEKYKSLLLHGYFNGRDRFKIESELLNGNIDLLIGTQSIEVSLDIDYDIIFTEPAPLDALLQRFGRVNRKRVKGICDCIVFTERNKSDKYIYKDEEIIERTLEVLEKASLQNEGIIDEKETQEYIDFVYPNWNEKLQDEFDKTYELLKFSVNELAPFIYSQNKEEEFYKQFDGIPVLPISLEKIYREHLDNFDFISAESLTVKIKSNMFAAWINSFNDNIRISNYVVGKEKTSTIKYYVTNKVYDVQLGLLRDESEDWNNFIETEFI